MKSSLILAAALFSLTAPALAEEPTEYQFEHDGISYVYSVETDGDSRILTGRHYPSGGRFRLVVRDGRVTGQMNGSSVRFRLSSVEGEIGEGLALASR